MYRFRLDPGPPLYEMTPLPPELTGLTYLVFLIYSFSYYHLTFKPGDLHEIVIYFTIYELFKRMSL